LEVHIQELQGWIMSSVIPSSLCKYSEYALINVGTEIDH